MQTNRIDEVKAAIETLPEAEKRELAVWLAAETSTRAELEALALEGLESGNAITPGPGYWEDKHRRLAERLASSR